MENALFNWTLINMPIVSLFIALVCFAVWITKIVIDHKHRLIKMEADTRRLKRTCRRLDERMDRLEQRVTRIEHKLDMLITHLTATKIIELRE